MAKNPHQLTRAEMEAVIAGGGSVMYRGQTINQVGLLPTQAELAKGDPEQEKVVTSELQAQVEALQKQIDELKSGAGASAQTGGETETPESKAAAKKAKQQAEAKAKADAEAAEAAKKAAEEEAKRLAGGTGGGGQ